MKIYFCDKCSMQKFKLERIWRLNEKMTKWWKDKKLLLIIGLMFLVFLFFICIPLIINEIYIKDEGYITVWGGAEVLTFYGSVLSFIGTVFLGALTFWQNDKLHSINKSLTEHQYKPILTNSIMLETEIYDSNEKHRTFYRKIEQDIDRIMINQVLLQKNDSMLK